MDEGAYMSKARSWNDTPLCVAESVQNLAVVFAPRCKGRLSVIGRSKISLVISYQGNQQRGMPLTSPLISYCGGDILI